jgi:hypothetical protein
MLVATQLDYKGRQVGRAYLSPRLPPAPLGCVAGCPIPACPSCCLVGGITDRFNRLPRIGRLFLRPVREHLLKSQHARSARRAALLALNINKKREPGHAFASSASSSSRGACLFWVFLQCMQQNPLLDSAQDSPLPFSLSPLDYSSRVSSVESSKLGQGRALYNPGSHAALHMAN